MVLVARHRRLGAPQENVLISRIGKILVAETKGHLVDHVDSQPVADVQQRGRRRIVRRAHGVEVALLHEFDVVRGVLRGDRPADRRMEIVMVHPPQLVRRRNGQKGDVPVNARKRPLVVRIKLPAFEPAVDPHRQGVGRAQLHERGHIKVAAVEAALEAPDARSIEPTLVAEEHSVEAQDQAPAPPRIGNRELPPVESLPFARLLVDGLLEPLHLPIARKSNLRPGRVVEFRLDELSGGTVQLEGPLAIERSLPLRVAVRRHKHRGRQKAGAGQHPKRQIPFARDHGLARERMATVDLSAALYIQSGQ